MWDAGVAAWRAVPADRGVARRRRTSNAKKSDVCKRAWRMTKWRTSAKRSANRP